MRKPIPLVLVVVLITALVALPALAETFTVKLKNGSSFATRYRPQEASWDPGTVMLLTDFGHWIALPRADIETVESELESRGFGKYINTTTIDLGIAPNDLPSPGEAEETTPLQQLQNMLQQQPQKSYDIQQFVDPGQAGQGGLPVGYGSGIGGGAGTAFIQMGTSGASGGGG